MNFTQAALAGFRLRQLTIGTTPVNVFPKVSQRLSSAIAAPVGALAGAGAGNVDNGVHGYKIVHKTAAGKTMAGSAVFVTVVDKSTNGKVALSVIPVGGTGTIAREIYRTLTAMTEGDLAGATYYLLATITDNSTTTYEDNIADASLGVTQAPTENTTGGAYMVDGQSVTAWTIYNRSGEDMFYGPSADVTVDTGMPILSGQQLPRQYGGQAIANGVWVVAGSAGLLATIEEAV